MRTIDYKLCNGCSGKYLCARDCPTGYIKIAENSPVLAERGRCINCGHCVAVCPAGAVSSGGEIPEEIRAGTIEPENLMHFFKSKRSVRFFSRERPIPEKDLDLILTAGQTAPTDMNRPTVRIIVVKKELAELVLAALEFLRKKLEPLGTIHPQYFGFMKEYSNKEHLLSDAEYLILVAGGGGYAVDAGIAAERMQLMAHSLGVATLYRGNLAEAFSKDESLRRKLNLRNNEAVHVAFAMGYADFEYARVVEKSNKKVEYR